MKFYFWFLALSMALISCKKNSQQLTPEQQQAKLQEQLDSIAKGVCDSATTKAGQKECFEKTFAALFQERLKKDPYEVTEPVTERILLNIRVDNTGKIVLLDMQADDRTRELLSTENESFEDSLRANLSVLSDNDAIKPATKNGQNVSTQFKLPVEINVK